MNAIGIVERRRPLGQLDHIALRGEAEHLIGIKLELHVLEEIDIVAFVEPLRKRRDPFRRIDGKGVLRPHAVAIGPVRRHPGFGHLVHLAGADLDFYLLAVTPRYGGVDRAVAVRLGLADVILEPPRHRLPALMDRTEDHVAILHVLGDHPKPVDIGQTRKAQTLLLHLAPDRIGLLGPAEHVGLDADLVEFMTDIMGDLVDHVAGFALERDEAADDRAAPLRVQHAKGKVLKLLAHPVHPHAPGEGRIDIHRLARLLYLLFRALILDRAHIVQPVGELHQDHPEIARHGDQELAEILRLLGLRTRKLKVGQLGHAIDKLGDVPAEALLHIGVRGTRVLHSIVQERGDDRRIVEPLFGQQCRNRHRMREIGLARMPRLTRMHFLAEGIGLADLVGIAARIVGGDQRDQVFDVNHSRPCPPSASCLSGFLRFHQGTQKPLLVHVVLIGTVGGFGAHQQRHRVLFGLVDLDLRLVGFDHPLAQIVRLLRLLGDLAQGNHGILVVVTRHRDLRTGRDLTRTMGGEHHQIETVRNLVNAIFHGHAGHRSLHFIQTCERAS